MIHEARCWLCGAHDGVPRPSAGRVDAIAHGRSSAKTDWGGSLQSAPRTDPERAGRRRRTLNGASCRRRPHPAPARRADPRARHAKAVPRRFLRRSRSQRRSKASQQKHTRTPPNGGFHTQPSITRPGDRCKRKTAGNPAYCVENRQRPRQMNARREPNAGHAPGIPPPRETAGLSTPDVTLETRANRHFPARGPASAISRRPHAPSIHPAFSILDRRRPRRRRSRRR